MKHRSIKSGLVCLLVISALSGRVKAQNIGYRYNDSIPSLLSATDTLLYPFAGGLTAPQFNSIDLDIDGKNDLLIFDRAGARILPYLNKGGTGEVKYQFAPQYIPKLPPCGNWLVTVDYNRDGKMDIFTPQTDPKTGTITGNLRVWLNTSNSLLSFQLFSDSLKEGSPKSYNPQFPTDSIPYFIPVSFSDHPAIADMDNDGDIDYLLPSGAGDILYYKNYQVEKGLSQDSFFYRIAEYAWGAVLIADPIELGHPNQKYYGFKANAHNGTAITAIDIDGDGDKDMLAGDISKNNLLLLKNGQKEYNWKFQNIPCDTVISFDTTFPAASPARMKQLLMAYLLDINNDNKQDMIVAPFELSDIRTVNQVWYYENTGTASVPAFTLKQTNFLQEEMIDLGGGFAPVLIDYDQDGDNDLLAATRGNAELYADANDRLVLFENTGSAGNPTYKLTDTNYLNLLSMHLYGIRPATADMNKDGKPDLLLGMGNGTLAYWQNNTSSGTGKISFAAPVMQFENINVGTGCSPAVFDLNYDSYPDLVLGNEAGRLQYFRNRGSSFSPYLFSNVPDVDTFGRVGTYTTFSNATIHPFLFDHRNDSMVELALGLPDGSVSFYRVSADLRSPFTAIDTCLYVPWSGTASGRVPGSSARPVPLISYIDHDTVPDLFVGNHYGGLYFYKGFNRGELPPILGRDTVTVKHTGIAGPNQLLHLYPYPNPAVNVCNMVVPENNYTIRVCDIRGSEKWVETQSGDRLRVKRNNLPAGIYFAQIISSNGDSYIARIIFK